MTLFAAIFFPPNNFSPPETVCNVVSCVCVCVCECCFGLRLRRLQRGRRPRRGRFWSLPSDTCVAGYQLEKPVQRCVTFINRFSPFILGWQSPSVELTAAQFHCATSMCAVCSADVKVSDKPKPLKFLFSLFICILSHWMGVSGKFLRSCGHVSAATLVFFFWMWKSAPVAAALAH